MRSSENASGGGGESPAHQAVVTWDSVLDEEGELEEGWAAPRLAGEESQG